MDEQRIVVIGASLAGLRAAETLRSDGFEGDVVVIGAEVHRPYDRPPLSKKLLAGEWDPDRIELRQADSFDELDVEWRFGMAAAGLDVAGKVVHLTDGTDLAYDGCVIATGSMCRRLPEQSRYPHVHELRTVDDAMRLRAEISNGGREVIVIGAGFIGLEVAGTAHRLGNRVTVLEGGDAPLTRGLGVEMGAAIGALHTAAGVSVRCGVQVDRLHDDGVLLVGGELVRADVVLVGIGVVPATAWLGDSGIEIRNGVVCDAALHALDHAGRRVDGVMAAGDVTRWPNGLFDDEEMRIEHWTNAAEQGALAAKNLLATMGGEEPQAYAPVPFFWSDQLGHRIQFVGRGSAGPDTAVTVTVAAGSTTGDGDEQAKWLALYSDPDTGRLRGALGVNAPRWVMPMRALVQERASLDDALSKASDLT
jgi:NADPH-dependent 2,4-dienoyl-CoA reductase/sulfur reductase-like enzyme